MNKRNKGITLIALVVTIVVLLILAGVSIAMLTGNNGIIKQAQKSKDRSEQSRVEELVSVAIGSVISKYNGNISGITPKMIADQINEDEGRTDVYAENETTFPTNIIFPKENRKAEAKLNTSSSSNGNNGNNGNTGSGDNTGSGGNNTGDSGNTGGGNTGGGTTPGENEDYKDLTVSDKIDRLKNMSAKLEVFDRSVSGTKSDYNATAKNNDFNEIGKPTSIEQAKCECGKVREIFNKAIEMGLVKDYADIETQKITNEDGTESSKEIIIAPIEEESIVLFDFYTYNFEQKAGEILPMAYSLNYVMNPNGKEWLDSGKPNFSKGSLENLEKDGGDTESILAWVNSEYAKNKFVGMQAVPALEKYRKYTVTELEQEGQVVHRKISVLTKTNFVKAMNALGLNLSAYEGKCTHPVK